MPILRSPATPTQRAAVNMPKKNQYAPRYPFISSSGPAASETFPPALMMALAVIVSAINVASVMPKVLPSWEMVLNTPPAKACVSAGKDDVIIRFEMVNEASAPIVFSMIAGNDAFQYIQCGSTRAIRTGAARLMREKLAIITSPRIR